MDVTKTGPAALYGQLQAVRPESAKTGVRPAAQEAAVPQGDTVTVSEEAILRTEAYRAAMNGPDSRQDKIDDLKTRLANGTYSIDSRRIAVNLLNLERDMLA